MAFQLRSQSPIRQEKTGTVKYGTPEYKSAYNKGEVVTKEGGRSPISLDEVVVSKKSPKKGFMKQSSEEYSKEHKDDSVLGAIGSVVTYPLEVGQHAMMYGLTGKVQKPSKALNVKNPIAATALDIVADPTVFGPGIVKGMTKAPKVIESASKLLGSGELVNAVKTGVSKLAKNVEVGIKGPSALNRDEYVSKFMNQGLPKGTSERITGDTQKAVNKNLDWIESDEYLNKRMANTGEWKSTVKRDVAGMKNRFMNTKVRGLQDEGVKGVYIPSKQGTKDLVKVNFEDFSEKGWYGTLQHEIGHALSPAGKKPNLYKNYNTLDVAADDAFSNYAGIRTPQEQQVRLVKMNEFVKKHAKLSPGENITEQHYTDWAEHAMNDPKKSLEKKHGDVYNFVKNTKDFNSTKKIVGTINKAWMAPAIVGGAAATTMNKK